MQIGVVGGSSATDEQAAWAEEVGARIAEAGAVLVCGGMGGVMESACRGARRAGGVVLGILPGASPDGGNRYITAAAATGMGEARNALVVRSCHAIVAVGGAWGTLSEIALALATGVPVVSLGSWRPRRDGVDGAVMEASDAAEAVAMAVRAAGGEPGGAAAP